MKYSRSPLLLFGIVASVFGSPSQLTSETRLDLYRGRILCSIEYVCEFGKACQPNSQFVRNFVVDFQDDGNIVLEFGISEPSQMVVLSPRPDGESIQWWNLAWMGGGPSILQIGFGHEFTMIEGPIENLGFKASPPITRTGKCEI